MKSGQKKWKKLRKLTGVARNGVAGIGLRGNEGRCKRLNAILRALNYFCTHTTLHGLRFVVDPELHIIGRLLWFVVFVVSSTIASSVIYSLALRFQAAPTSIDIESMHYETSNLPFPSVTLCPNDRVDWDRALELEPRLFSNVTDKESVETFRKILGKLSMMSFGDFDDLDFLKEQSVHRLADINITQVLHEVMPRCDQLLSACWWRNANRNCCEIFEVQKTEYGFCYSFNSELAQTAPADLMESRPRRASGYGDWSGVKVTIHLGNIKKPPNSEEIDGVVVIINGPRVWPNSGTMIPSGSLISVSLECVSGHATQRVLELDQDKQPCRYDETGVYNQETCLSLCKRHWVARHCGCNPSFLFPSTSRFRDCTIEDFICLAAYNDLFNDYIVHFGDEYPRDIPSMICSCLPECDYYVYGTQFSNVPLHNMNDIMLDVHYIGQTSFRYKTDIVITQMDLLVSFGGIIGLFLGGSLLSAVEIVYYLTVAVFSSLRSRQRTEGKPRARSSVTHVHATVLPILDYNLLKPQAKRIPIFANYGLAELNLNRY
ncbi:PREDICTED: pickpocket protein 19-like [Vollenhovia emeryi]|uniref:pickpocket protein 19-like n=1 Tax=Vollenhovia emeryi TaxID=411798 RepID=UPI0005F54E4D|nr:PREDICTED: pickpocket protein 19-like [Vollenhovia emeryi]